MTSVPCLIADNVRPEAGTLARVASDRFSAGITREQVLRPNAELETLPSDGKVRRCVPTRACWAER